MFATGKAMASFSRLIRFLPRGEGGGRGGVPLIGEPCDRNQDVGLASYHGDKIDVEVFSGTTILAPGHKIGQTRQVQCLLSPLGASEVGTIRCIGLNVSVLSIDFLDLAPLTMRST